MRMFACAIKYGSRSESACSHKFYWYHETKGPGTIFVMFKAVWAPHWGDDFDLAVWLTDYRRTHDC